MKVHTIQKPGSMAAIADSGSLPITKQPLPAEGLDAKMQGNVLADEVMALATMDQNRWHRIAWTIIRMTTDARAAYLKAIKKRLSTAKEAVEEAHGEGAKNEQKMLRSATTQVSNCNTIANAFNAGATIEGLVEFHKVSDPENLGFLKLVEYARTFSKATAGRKPDPLLVKLHKWLEANKKTTDTLTAEDLAVLRELTDVYKRLAAEQGTD
jgi:hypothetical protein